MSTKSRSAFSVASKASFQSEKASTSSEGRKASGDLKLSTISGSLEIRMYFIRIGARYLMVYPLYLAS